MIAVSEREREFCLRVYKMRSLPSELMMVYQIHEEAIFHSLVKICFTVGSCETMDCSPENLKDKPRVL